MFCCKEMMNYNLNFPPCKKCHRVTFYNLSEQTVSCSSCLCLASNKIGSVNKRPDQLFKTWGDFVWDGETYKSIQLAVWLQIKKYSSQSSSNYQINETGLALHIWGHNSFIFLDDTFIRRNFSERNSPRDGVLVTGLRVGTLSHAPHPRHHPHHSLNNPS